MGLDNRNVCAVCNEPIYNPVCALCLTDQIESWIEKRKLSYVKEFRQEVRVFLDKVRRYNRLNCSVCRVETDKAVCPVCFTENIFAWLTRKDKSLATDLIKTFRYTMPKEEDKLEYA